MDITTCLIMLADAGAVCRLVGEALDIDLAPARWTDNLIQAVADVKPMLMRLLTLAPAYQASAETLLGWCDLYEERAAILEYESGLSRDEAERQAWTILYETIQAAL